MTRLLDVLAWAVLVALVSGCEVERRGEWRDAKVGEASYTPSHSVTGIGPSMSGKGGVAMTFSTVPASHVVTFYLSDGKVSADRFEWWRACNVGDSVQVFIECRRFKGDGQWKCEAESLRKVLR